MKRLTSILLAIAMFIQVGYCVEAMETPDDMSEYKSEFDILFKTDILTVDEYGNFAPKVNLKRNEMCYTLAKMAGVSTESQFEQIFSDVDESVEYAYEINALQRQNILSGSGDGTFNPDAYVLVQDVLVPIVKILGVEDLALAKGGYPKGYISVAREHKLLKGVQSGINGLITKLDFARIVANAVECPLYEISGMHQGGGMIKEKSDETLLSKNHNILKITGLVSANQYGGISRSAVGIGSVVVGEELLFAGDTDISKHLGYSVEAYYDRDTNIIKSYRFDKRCTTFQITDEQEPSFDGNILSYIKDETRTKQEKIDASTVILYNLKPIKDIRNITGDIKDAIITCVDNNGDNNIDTLVVNKFQHKIVRYLDIGSKILFLENETEPIYLEQTECEFYDYDGMLLDETYVKKGSAVSIIESEDGKNVQFYLGNSPLVGIVEGVSDDRVTIDGMEYRWCQSFDTSKFRVGDTMTFQMSIDNKIIDISKAIVQNSGRKIGYIVDYEYLLNEEQVRIKMAAYGEENPIKYYVADKIMVDGARLKPEKLFNRLENNKNNNLIPLVTYETDSSDNLIMLNTMFRGPNEDPDEEIYESHIADGQTYTWRSSAKMFNIDKKANNQIIMSDNAVAVYVSQTDSSKTECAITTLSLGNDATKSDFNTYRIGRNSISEDIIMFNESAKTTMHFDRYMSLSVIEKIKVRYNDATELVQTCVTMRTNGSRQEAFIMEDRENNFEFYIDAGNTELRNKYGLAETDEMVLLALQPGDVVKVSYSDTGEINGGQILFRNDIKAIESQKILTDTDGVTYPELYNNEDFHYVSRCLYGYVYDLEGNVLLVSKYSPDYIREHGLTEAQMYKLCEKHRIPSEVYTWKDSEKAGSQFAIADTQEIYSVRKNGSMASKVFIYSIYSGDRMMMVYKNY